MLIYYKSQISEMNINRTSSTCTISLFCILTETDQRNGLKSANKRFAFASFRCFFGQTTLGQNNPLFEFKYYAIYFSFYTMFCTLLGKLNLCGGLFWPKETPLLLLKLAKHKCKTSRLRT